MARRLIAPKRTLSEEDLERYVAEYKKDRELEKIAKQRADEKKAALVEYIEANGYTDDKGNQWVDVADGVRLKRERRVSQGFDAEKAEAWLKKNKRYDEFTETIVQLDVDAIYAAAYQNEIPSRTFDSWLTRTETMAFKVEG